MKKSVTPLTRAGAGKTYHSVSFINFLYSPARIAPEILCQTEKIAPGTVAIASCGNTVPARLILSFLEIIVILNWKLWKIAL